MPTIETVHFGPVDIAQDSLIDFPSGLPAFESERRFVLIRKPHHEPLLFLQSLSTPSLAFLAIAVEDILLDYHVEISDEEMATLGGPDPDSEFDLLALITISPGGEVSANLQAPIVIHRLRHRAVQAIQSNPAYSCRHPLGAAPSTPHSQESPCS